MDTPAPPVLLIDDNPDDLILTQGLLKRAGVDNPILTANGGEEAMELLRNCSTKRHGMALPQFVLCDVRMPRVNGFDLLAWVRKEPELNKLYFALHSGGNVPSDRVRACDLGANEFLVKFP